MLELSITPKAESDLVGIWVYTCGEWGIASRHWVLPKLKRYLNMPKAGGLMKGTCIVPLAVSALLSIGLQAQPADQSETLPTIKLLDESLDQVVSSIEIAEPPAMEFFSSARNADHQVDDCSISGPERSLAARADSCKPPP